MTAVARDDTSAASSGRSRFHRFTTRNRCPHCDHDGPCISFDNGDVLCHREGKPDNWTDSFIGGYWHRAESAAGGRPAPRRMLASPLPQPSAPQPSAPVNVDTRHAVYTDIIRMCPLSEAQRIAHHLTEAQASRYGWLPGDANSQAAIMAALLRTYSREDLLSVPGFREQNGHIKIRGAGLMLPTRDLDGKIQAIDLRRDTVKDGQARYYKLSSRTDDDEDAPSPGAPPHVAIPVGGVTVISVIGITEGVKKADYAADALGYPVISIAGIGSRRDVPEVLERFAGSVVVLMLDQDDPAKGGGRVVADVKRAQQALATTAISLGYAVRLTTWNYTHAKGIDDLLAAGETFIQERYRPHLELVPNLDADHACGETSTDSPPMGTPTIEEALALPHPVLARRYVDARARLRAADDTLAYIARITKHQAVITPSDDPEAKRKRPVLSHADRVIGVNYALDMRAAGKGLLPTAPVSVYRSQIAAASCASPSTVTASTQQLARAGFLDVTPAPGEREAQLFALPATMPGDISPDNLVDFESSRRRKERRRVCKACGVGTRFEHTTVCMECGNKEVEIIGGDDEQGGVVASCNTKVLLTERSVPQGSTETSPVKGGVVASCNHPPSPRVASAIGDRAARAGNRASRDDLPRRTEPDDDDDDDDVDDVAAFFAANPPPATAPPPPRAAVPQTSPPKPSLPCPMCRRINWHQTERDGLMGWTCRCLDPTPATIPLHILDSTARGQQEVRHGH